MTTPLRVLFVLSNLKNRSGMVLHVRDLAAALQAQGHAPFVYAPKRGIIGDELRSLRIPVLDSLDALHGPPDIIHGHTHVETVLALLRIPDVPVVSTTHGLSWHNDPPPQFSRVMKYLAVSSGIRDRLIQQHGLSPPRVEVLLNSVDLDRFAPRSPLPARPARALVFNGLPLFDHHPAIVEACAARGMSVEVIGGSREERVAQPWTVLGDYDVIFARGRCATEAAAVGAAVIVCGREGLGPLVTTSNLAETHSANFGADLLAQPVTTATVAAQLGGYDSLDAAEVSRRIRLEVGLDRAADIHVALYRTAIDEYAPTRDWGGDPSLARRAIDQDARLTADYVERLNAYHRRVLDETSLKLRDERDDARKWAGKLHADRTALTAKVSEMGAELRRLREDVPRLVAERDRALVRLRSLQASALFRIQARLGGIRSRIRGRSR